MNILTSGRLVAATIAAMAGAAAHAAPVSIGTPFMNLEHRAINSLGFGAGEFLRFGAVSVTPNGAAGTTGLATTTNLLTGGLVTRTINFNPGPVIPNFFSRYIPDDAALHGPWTLSFSNGADRRSVTVTLPEGTTQAPFVESITLSGTAAHPTFSWAPPPGAVVNGYRLNIYDKSIINFDPSKGPLSNGQVTSRDVPPGVTSYTVTPGDFTVPGYAFALDRNYSIEISLLQTRDGSTNTSNANLKAVARVYADFTPREGGGPVVNLPVVREDGVYVFNMTVEAGRTYHIDPEVAIGYDYAIGAGDPNFRSVILPTDIGDGRYDIFGFAADGSLIELADDWAGGASFDFGASGVTRFRVMGIETSAALDPLNTTAFITGLTFTGSGRFTGTQAPITAEVPGTVSEAPTLALACLALWAMRRRTSRQRA